MIFTFGIIGFVASLLLEFFVYRTAIRRACNRRWMRTIYIIKATALPVATVTAMLLYGWELSPVTMKVQLWVTWLFLTNLLALVATALPLVTAWIIGLFNAHRRGENRWARITGAILSLLITSVMLYGVCQRDNLRVERIEVVSEKIPAAFDGYTIAQFSDAHLGNLSFTNILKDLADQVEKEKPDLVVQSGDLLNIHDGEFNVDNIKDLSEIKAQDGVVSVLGNHDLGFYIKNPRDTTMTPQRIYENNVKTQRRLGWNVLENQNIIIRRGADSIVVAGVTYPRNMNHNNFNSTYGGSDLRKSLTGTNDSAYRVMVSHTPTLFDSIPKVVDADLMLSGHVHSFQMKFGDWSPAKLLYPMYSGIYDNNGRKLYINDGLGYVLYPMRIGTRPELTIITLRRPGAEQRK